MMGRGGSGKGRAPFHGRDIEPLSRGFSYNWEFEGIWASMLDGTGANAVSPPKSSCAQKKNFLTTYPEKVLPLFRQPDTEHSQAGRHRDVPGHGMRSASFNKWHELGGMDAFILDRLEKPGEEERRLKKVNIEERLKAEATQEAIANKY